MTTGVILMMMMMIMYFNRLYEIVYGGMGGHHLKIRFPKRSKFNKVATGTEMKTRTKKLYLSIECNLPKLLQISTTSSKYKIQSPHLELRK